MGVGRPAGGRSRAHRAELIPSAPADGAPALLLREAQESDLADVLDWVDGPAATVLWAGPALFHWPLDPEQLQRWLIVSREPDSRSRILAATLPASASTVGLCELAAIRPGESAILCRVIVDPKRRGAGLGTAMAAAAVRLGLEALGLQRIELRVYDVNPVAVRCYEKAGFTHVGRLAEPQIVGGERWGVLVMALERDRPLARASPHSSERA